MPSLPPPGSIPPAPSAFAGWLAATPCVDAGLGRQHGIFVATALPQPAPAARAARAATGLAPLRGRLPLGAAAVAAPAAPPPAPPAAPAAPTTSAAGAADELPISLSATTAVAPPSLNALLVELRTADFYQDPSSLHVPNPADLVPQRASAHITSYGLIISGPMAANVAGSGILDGTSATFVAAYSPDSRNCVGSLSLADGLATAVIGGSGAVGGQLSHCGGQLQAWRDRIRLGVVGVRGTVGTDMFGALGGYAQLVPTAKVTDGGEYSGDDADAIAAAHGIDRARDGMHAIDLSRSWQLSGTVLGGGMRAVMGLGRGVFGGGRQRSFHTYLDDEQTRAVVCEGRGLRQYLRDRLRAVRLRRDVIAVPALTDWERLRHGDVLSETISHSSVIDALLGQIYGWGGAQWEYRADVEITVAHVDAGHIDVTYTPTRVHDAQLYLFQPAGLRLDRTCRHARSYRQCLRFDITRAEGRAALSLAVRGRLACQRETPAELLRNLPPGISLTDLVARQNAALPPGVERRFVHVIRNEEHRSGGGLHFSLLPRELLPHGWVNAAMRHGSHGKQDQSITDGTTDEHAQSHTHAHHWLRGLAGMWIDAATARRHWGPAAPPQVEHHASTQPAELSQVEHHASTQPAELLQAQRDPGAQPPLTPQPRHDGAPAAAPQAPYRSRPLTPPLQRSATAPHPLRGDGPPLPGGRHIFLPHPKFAFARAAPRPERADTVRAHPLDDAHLATPPDSPGAPHGGALPTVSASPTAPHADALVTAGAPSAPTASRVDARAPVPIPTLELSTLMQRTCVRGTSHNQSLVAPLNRRFDLRLGRFTRSGRGLQRDVQVQRTFAADDIAAIVAAIAPPPGRPLPAAARAPAAPGRRGDTSAMRLASAAARRQRAELGEVAARSGVRRRDLSALGEALAAACDVAAQAALLEAFIGAHGVAAMAALHLLAPARRALAVGSASAAYTTARDAAARVALCYVRRPLTATAGARAIGERLARARDAATRTDAALRDLADDPLLDAPSRRSIRGELDAGRSALMQAVAAAPHERAAIEASLATLRGRRRRRLGGMAFLYEAPESHVPLARRLAAAGPDAAPHVKRERAGMLRTATARAAWLRGPEATLLREPERQRRLADARDTLTALGASPTPPATASARWRAGLRGLRGCMSAAQGAA